MMHDRAALWILCETLLTQILSCSDATLCSSQRILDHQYKSRVYWSGVNSQCTSSQVFFSLELICNCSHVSWLPPQHFFWLKEIKKMSYLWCNVKQICSFVDLTKNLHSTNFDMFGINILEVSPEDFIFFLFLHFWVWTSLSLFAKLPRTTQGQWLAFMKDPFLVRILQDQWNIKSSILC